MEGNGDNTDKESNDTGQHNICALRPGLEKGDEFLAPTMSAALGSTRAMQICLQHDSLCSIGLVLSIYFYRSIVGLAES